MDERRKKKREEKNPARLDLVVKKAANMDLGRFDLDCACRYYGGTSELGPSWKNRKGILLLMSPAFLSWARTAEKLLLLHGPGSSRKVRSQGKVGWRTMAGFEQQGPQNASASEGSDSRMAHVPPVASRVQSMPLDVIRLSCSLAIAAQGISSWDMPVCCKARAVAYLF